MLLSGPSMCAVFKKARPGDILNALEDRTFRTLRDYRSLPLDNDDDVLYQDADICILHPRSTRGIEVYNRSSHQTVTSHGLYSMNKVREVFPELSSIRVERRHDDTIFFRAPKTEDTTSTETLYETDFYDEADHSVYSFIRIDPDKSFVFNGEIRVNNWDNQYNLIRNSRTTMDNYFNAIRANREVLKTCPPGHIPIYNTYSYRLDRFEKVNDTIEEDVSLNCFRSRKIKKKSRSIGILRDIDFDFYDSPHTTCPSCTGSELLAVIDHIPLEWMTRCLYKGVDYAR